MAMRRVGWVAAAMLGSVALPQAAGASGDYGCEPGWKLASRAYDTCGSQAFLTPGNDSRVNLLFLLRDRQGAAAPAGLTYPPSFNDPIYGHNFFGWRSLREAFYGHDPEADRNDYYGSRCISLSSGNTAFASALQAARGVPASERERLAEARSALVRRCEAGGADAAAAAWPTDIASASGREFLAYLQAADAFYAEQWPVAHQGFEGLRGSRDPWLAEAAAYMVARADLNAAQAAAFGDWGEFDAAKVDKPALARAKAGFGDYLTRYAQGRYAASARGLVRRALWLSGDVTGLSREYERLLASVPAADRAAAELVEEVDNKLLIPGDAKAVDGPLLLAALDLMAMRDPGRPEEGEEPGLRPKVITAEEIAAQAPRFAGRPELYGYIQASHAFYVDRNMAKVLSLIPDDARKPAYAPLAFSRQVLRGMALAALGDRNEAGFWRDLLAGAHALYQRPVVELALAMSLERSGRLAEVFAAGSPIKETAIREILLLNVAGPGLLRAQAGDASRPQHERELALFTLLRKQLGHGDYAGFVRDVELVPAGSDASGSVWQLRSGERVPVGMFRQGPQPDGYACPALKVTAARLAHDSRDVKGRLCLGEFYRRGGFDDFDAGVEPPKRDELGGTPTLFPGRLTPRGDFYADIIADPKAAPNDKAYALFRAIYCYAPSGSNSCGNADVPESQRRAWFQRLKRDYPNSSWSRQLRYYW